MGHGSAVQRRYAAPRPGHETEMMHPAVMNGGYDANRIREDFPALALEVYGKPLVYLDNAASAQKPRAVLDRLEHAYTAEYSNVHRGLHYLANAATEAYEGAREKVRAFLNAEKPQEIIFTRNATEAINLVAYTFGVEQVRAGDEIVLSILEHHSNIVPWHFLRERHGAVIKWAPLADARGIPVLLDGSQAAVHRDVDVRDIGCDFYVFTGHKLYGPTGAGVLYGRYDHLAAMRPFNGGGEMIREVYEDRVTYGDPPNKFEAGTPAIVQAIGLGAAIDYVGSIGKERIRAHEAALVKYAHERLREINRVRIFGTTRDKGPIVAFDVQGAHPHDIATIIDHSGVAVRAGTHCTMPLLARYGVSATCRASFGLYNTAAEVDSLAQALMKAQDFFA